MIDKNGILKAVEQLEKAEGAVELTQQKIIGKVIEQMVEIPHVSRIAIIEEAVKSFPSTAKKVGGEGYTRYQYTSRLKAIIGAKFLVPGFELVGGVNAQYSAAVNALKEAGLNSKGEEVAKVQETKAQSTREALEKEELYKATQNNPNKTAAELKAHVEKVVDKAMADNMLTKIHKNAETFGDRMLKNNGLDYAEEFAKALLAHIRNQAKKEEKAAA